MLEKINQDTEMPMVQSMVHYLLQHQMITTREAALMMQVVGNGFQSESITPTERVHLLKSMLLTLENFS